MKIEDYIAERLRDAGIRREIIEAFSGWVSGFSPVTVLSLLREVVPSTATVTADVGLHLHLLGQFCDVKDGRLIMTNGWSSMGFGLPAAIAAALAGNGEHGCALPVTEVS
jgi:acetolactate synthase-1/2/3 large subunit